jgi:hypothetical protein
MVAYAAVYCCLEKRPSCVTGPSCWQRERDSGIASILSPCFRSAQLDVVLHILKPEAMGIVVLVLSLDEAIAYRPVHP